MTEPLWASLKNPEEPTSEINVTRDAAGAVSHVDSVGERGMGTSTILTPRFDDALVFARRIHAEQVRKGTSVPYAAHLLGVTALVLEHGGTEDEAIAALLHDAVEDQGGLAVLEQIRQRFGDTVASIVEGCTDAAVNPKPPWKARKQAYIRHLAETSPSVRLVSAADKLHNARAILADYRNIGEELWPRFNGGKDGTLWYYRALVDAFREAGTSSIVDDLDRTVSEIEHLAQISHPSQA